MENTRKLIKKIKYDYIIEVKTGLHIGGSKDALEIGGIDTPVIRLATNNQPYIPGSSLKGKMRCLLEQIKGVVLGGDDNINMLFGSNDPKNPSPSRIIVRDAMLTPESDERLKKCSNLDAPYTENKFENSIDRIKGVANKGIRQIERVPAGAEFACEVIINVWEGDKEEDLKDMFNRGLKAIENDYLGGSGSRGYGQVAFQQIGQYEMSSENGWIPTKS